MITTTRWKITTKTTPVERPSWFLSTFFSCVGDAVSPIDVTYRLLCFIIKSTFYSMQCKCRPTSVWGRQTIRLNSGQASTQISTVCLLPWVLFRANRNPYTYNPVPGLVWSVKNRIIIISSSSSSSSSSIYTHLY